MTTTLCPSVAGPALRQVPARALFTPVICSSSDASARTPGVSTSAFRDDRRAVLAGTIAAAAALVLPPQAFATGAVLFVVCYGISRPQTPY